MITNNTNVPLNIEWGGKMQCEGLETGKTYPFELWAFQAGGQMVLEAKGYHGGRYIGTTSRSWSLPYQNHTQEFWIIESLSPPVDVTTNRRP
ncbi:MAG: hypothetical protein AAB534_03540 [Patescibacteria group bacterium]